MLLGFVQSWLSPQANPIGVDFGRETLRLAQVQVVEGEHRLVAAASADVPGHVRNDPAAKLAFFVEATRDLLSQGKFRGRQAILGLPAWSMHIQHLKLPKMDEDGVKKALPWEVRGKLPIDPSHAVLRHIIAGEIYNGQEPQQEVICLAAAKETVNQLLASAAKAKLDVVGMNVEPQAVIDCFGQVYRRKTDQESTTCYIDIGSSSTRVVIARHLHILFARTIPIGGEHFTRAAADALKINVDEARLLRTQMAQQPEKPENIEPRHEEESFALLHAALPAEAKPKEDDPFHRIEQALREPLHRLIEELDWCRRYHETTFAKFPIDRLLFIGGESRNKALCQTIAREMHLAAQLGDPMVRMSKTTEVGPESGLDRRQPQPAWTVALGLSMGSILAPAALSKEKA
jgi:type IV pilus assembly protein PilM